MFSPLRCYETKAEIVMSDSGFQDDPICDSTADGHNFDTSVENTSFPEGQSQCEVLVLKPNCDGAAETAQGKSQNSKKLFKDRIPKRPLVAPKGAEFAVLAGIPVVDGKYACPSCDHKAGTKDQRSTI